ncbi:uncharacterized protein LOC116204495 isoform X2 [Punica granatum]|uniref:Uncharacterized protein LOC116204495 isoform X2 n=1 Tax=Punica granatum TaxID=22663 RepID=A0A6P8DLD1_PUNGR|nr:uncharacterized protein LOC116204495 isoform X2 [Punica granatum]
MILALSLTYPASATRRRAITPFPSPTFFVSLSKFPSNCGSRTSFKCSCTENGDTHEASFQGFSVLGPESDVPWDSGTVWSTLSFYLFSLHIPLSFGGLSIVAHVLHQPILDPQTEAASLLGIQLFELVSAVCLLQSTTKRRFRLMSIFKADESSADRNALLGSALGFGSLVLLVFLSSFLADNFLGPKSVNNSVLKEILLSSNLSRAACSLAYCIIIPLLEELVYRGFLLRSISRTMKWHQAVLLSSAIFSAIHFSESTRSRRIFV